MKHFPLRLVTPNRELFNGEVEHVRLPGQSGHFGVLAGHAPLLAILHVGAGNFRVPDGKERAFALTGGYAEVLPEGVTVIARTVEFPEEIDAARADEARKRASGRIKSHERGTDLDRARSAYARAQLRLNLSRLTARS